MTTLLIDGDVLVYKVGSAVERPYCWGNDEWTLHADAREAKQRLDSTLASLKKDLKADRLLLALSCTTAEGFRRQLCPTYKANRNKTRKPVVHSELRRYLFDNYGATLQPGLEADDVLGMWATEPSKEHRILVSIDKDFRGVPCNLYNYDKPELGIVSITPEAAAEFHALQTLMGDATDGYAGIPGVGPARAAKLLAGVAPADRWATILAAYAKAGMNPADALLTARLAYILRHPDFVEGKITLWTPPRFPAPAPSPCKTVTPASPSK